MPTAQDWSVTTPQGPIGLGFFSIPTPPQHPFAQYHRIHYEPRSASAVRRGSQQPPVGLRTLHRDPSLGQLVQAPPIYRQKLRCDANCRACAASCRASRSDASTFRVCETKHANARQLVLHRFLPTLPRSHAPALASMPKHSSGAVGCVPTEARPREASNPAMTETRPRPNVRGNAQDDRAGILKPEIVICHKDSAMASHGLRNSAIWQDVPSRDADVDVSPMSVLSRRSHRLERMAESLTTLPLPGDLNNPLSVLVQASAAAEWECEGSDERVGDETGRRDVDRMWRTVTTVAKEKSGGATTHHSR